MFFFLVQTEQGDIFKIQLETDGDMVTEIKLKYFDTVPVATTMNVLKTGMYFVTLSIICSFDNHFTKDLPGFWVVEWLENLYILPFSHYFKM